MTVRQPEISATKNRKTFLRRAGRKLLVWSGLLGCVLVIALFSAGEVLWWRLSHERVDLAPILSSRIFTRFSPVLIRNGEIRTFLSSTQFGHIYLSLPKDSISGGRNLAVMAENIMLPPSTGVSLEEPKKGAGGGPTQAGGEKRDNRAFFIGKLVYNVDLSALWHGHVVPKHFLLSEGIIRLKRYKSGVITLDSPAWPQAWQWDPHASVKMDKNGFSSEIIDEITHERSVIILHHLHLSLLDDSSPSGSFSGSASPDGIKPLLFVDLADISSRGGVLQHVAIDAGLHSSFRKGGDVVFHAFLPPLQEEGGQEEGGQEKGGTDNVEAQKPVLRKWVMSLGPVVPAELAAWCGEFGFSVPESSQAAFRQGGFPLNIRAEGAFLTPPLKAAAASLSQTSLSGLTSFERALPWADIVVHMGEGMLTPKPGATPLHILRGTAKLHFDQVPAQDDHAISGKISENPHENLKRLTLSLPDLTLQDSAGKPVILQLDSVMKWDKAAAPHDSDIDLHVFVPKFDFATLASIWPEGALKGARRWMTANMSVGKGENLDIQAHLATRTGLADLDVTSLKGDLYGHDLTVTWLRPVQPVTGVEAHAFFITPDIVQIDVSKGRMKDGIGGFIAVPSGSVKISGLMHDDQDGDIELLLTGRLPSFLKILSHPRLHLLSRISLPIRNPSGDIDTHFYLSLPLLSDVEMKQIKMRAELDCKNISLDSDVLGTIRQGKGHADLTDEWLEAKGFAVVRHIPVEASFMAQFVQGPPGHIMRRLTAKAWVTREILSELGVDIPARNLQGAMMMEARFLQRGLGDGHNTSKLALDLDLTKSAIILPLWKKPEGIDARLQGRMIWYDGLLQAIDNVRATGPDIELKARIGLFDHQVNSVLFEPLRLGRNHMKLSISRPVKGAEARPYHVSLEASALDVSPFLFPSSGTQERGKKPDQDMMRKMPQKLSLPSGKWQIDAQVQKLFYKSDRALSETVLHASWQDQQVQDIHFSIQKPSFFMFSLKADPQDSQYHKLKIRLDDLGTYLTEIGDYHRLSGGRIVLEGSFSPAHNVPANNLLRQENPQKGQLDQKQPDQKLVDQQKVKQNAGLGFGLDLAPFEGFLHLSGLTLNHPPGVITAATVLTPWHWGQIGRDKFENIDSYSDIHVADEQINIRNGQIGNGVLGGTFTGSWNARKDFISANGTISPVFPVNAAPGRIPKIGYVFAPEKGSGVVALTYSVSGPLNDPKIEVNPLTVLMPGILRNLAP